MRITIKSFVLVVLCCACSTSTSASEPQDFELSDAGVGSQSYRDREPEQLSAADFSAPGEADTVEKAGCAYIQWCDAPGSREVVCVQSRTCYGDDTVIECFRDAEYVCGRDFGEMFIDWL